MMNMKFYLWLVAFGVLTSCVDDKYNLDKIDTDDIIVGDEWVFPLGTVDVKVTDVIDLDDLDGIVTTDGQGNYSARYIDGYDVNYENNTGIEVPEIPNNFPIVAFEIGDLGSMFGDGLALGLDNPHLKLNAVGLKGAGKINANLNLKAQTSTSVISSENAFELSATKPDIWIGSIDPKNDYTYYPNTKLTEMVAGVPEKITIQIKDFVLPSRITALQELSYTLELPFVPSGEFSATTTQSIDDIFDESMVDYLFSSGSATIFGTITNELPFDADVIMSITDGRSSKPLITLPMQEVKGTGARPVSFEIAEKMMPLMKEARNIELEFKLKGRTANKEYLNKNQTMKMELKLRKKGGIKVEA